MSQMAKGRDAGLAPGARRGVQDQTDTGAIAQGARVMTLDGALPVEFLSPGDRVVTRSGAMRLRAIEMRVVPGPMIRIAASGLGDGRPDRPLLLAPATPVLLRGWRARAIFGAPQALVAVARLVNGDDVTRVSGDELRCFVLGFDTAQVIYVDGVEVGCVAMAAPAVAAA